MLSYWSRTASLLLAIAVTGVYAKPPPSPPTTPPQASSGRLAESLFKQGLEHYRQGKLDAATAAWQRALRKFEEANDSQRSAHTLGNLGIVLKDQGHYARALVYHRRALAILEGSSDRGGQAQVLINLGITYEGLGDYFKAREAFEAALGIVKALCDRARESAVLGNLGGVYAKTGAYQKATSHYQESLAISEGINDLTGKAYALQNLGSVHHAQGQIRKAIDHYTHSLALAKRVRGLRLQAEILINFGAAEEDLGHYDKAIRHQRQAGSIAKKLGDPRLRALALNNLGHTYFSAGDLVGAEQALRDAVDLYDSLRPGLTDTAKVSVFDTQILTYNLLQQILVAQKNYASALEVAEQGRARAFIDLLAQRLSPQRASAIEPPTLRHIQQIAREHQATLVEYSIVPEDAFKVQGKLRGRAGTLYIWVVQASGEIGFRPVDLISRNLPITELVGQLRDALGVRGQLVDLGSTINNAPLRELHRYLIEPIADLLPADPNARVIFIPQDTLFLVPFPALQDSGGRYLIDRHTVLTAPAIQLLDLTQKQWTLIRDLKRADALIVGNPAPMPVLSALPDSPAERLNALPGTEHEAVDIAKMLNTEALITTQATKAAVVSRMPEARIIHLATHGILDDFPGKEIPGAIALAPSGTDNGLMTAEEILNLKLSPDLVVLSACDTGSGHITGDGVIGLSRALIAAGAPSVLVSLWKVPDEATAELMKAFYRLWLDGHDKAQALRQAMIATRRAYPTPRDWAAFTLIGEAR